MKSSEADLRRRGLADCSDIEALSGRSFEELTKLLFSGQAAVRSAAAFHLKDHADAAASLLLDRLSAESCLYTRIAICEALEGGGRSTAEKMTEYLGVIGNNQYKVLPDRVSAKKSYPLPRDIIARTMGKMDPSVLPVLLHTLETAGELKVREALDAVGFMVFYHEEVAGSGNIGPVLTVVDRYPEDVIILWKQILCLSAFPLKESENILEGMAKRNDILGNEARRSIQCIRKKQKAKAG